MIIPDTKSMVGDSLDVGDTEDTSVLGEGPWQGFIFEDMLWDANWVDNMDLYDDLDNWR